MDQEFRKPFEYDEEKRGLILLFVIMLIAIDSLQTLTFILRFYEYFQNIPVIGIGFMVLGILFMLFTFFTAFVCFRLKKSMVSVSKKYLVVRAIVTAGSIITLFLYAVNNDKMVGNGLVQYKSTGEMIAWELIMPFVYLLTFSVGWYLYFTKSKRCKEIVRQ